METFREQNRKFRILSLDGGGIRGAFIAACIAEFERQLKRPVTDYFDLIAGTSTGGIIALALGLGEPAERVKFFYKEYGPRIFTRPPKRRSPQWLTLCLKPARKLFPFLRSIDEEQLFQAKYSAEPLREALVAVFGERTLEDAIHSRLIIPSVDLITGQTITFKTPHQPGFVRDRHFKAVDVALATAAAPTYFPHAVIQPGSAYSDGGLWANNPTVVAIAEAIKLQRIYQQSQVAPSFNIDDICLLSIGTGKPRYFAKPDQNSDGGLWWIPKLFDVASGAQAQGTHFEANYILGDCYKRIDFEMPSAPWPLDAVETSPELFHIGQQKAVESFAGLRPMFFSQLREKIHFFDMGS